MILYSIIETAKANGLIVEKYLVYLLDVLSNTEIKNKDLLLDVIPSSKRLPQELKIPAKKQKTVPNNI